jgi:hypothetical protein
MKQARCGHEYRGWGRIVVGADQTMVHRVLTSLNQKQDRAGSRTKDYRLQELTCAT